MKQKLVIAKVISFYGLTSTSIHWIIEIEYFKNKGTIKIYSNKVCSLADALSWSRYILENKFNSEEKYHVVKHYMMPNRNLRFLHDGD